MGCDSEQIRLEVVNKSGAPQCTNQIENQSEGSALTLHDDVTVVVGVRVTELGSFSSGAKMAMKIFVKRVSTIFGTNASFLRVIANLQT